MNLLLPFRCSLLDSVKAILKFSIFSKKTVKGILKYQFFSKKTDVIRLTQSASEFKGIIYSFKKTNRFIIDSLIVSLQNDNNQITFFFMREFSHILHISYSCSLSPFTFWKKKLYAFSPYNIFNTSEDGTSQKIYLFIYLPQQKITSPHNIIWIDLNGYYQLNMEYGRIKEN